MMKVTEAIETRRSYRALETIEITKDIVKGLAHTAQLSPSCFNNQPWRFVFVHEKEQLDKVKETLAGGNYWAKRSSMIIVVFSKPDLDCQSDNIDYYQYDTGMATGMMMLKATEMGLVMHPIAGFDIVKLAEAVKIPKDYKVIALLIVGKRASDYEKTGILGEKHAAGEKDRPPRKEIAEIVFENEFKA